MLCHKAFLSKNKGSIISWSRVATLLKKKKLKKKKLEQKASPDGCSSYPAEFLLCFKELSVLRLSEKRIFDSLPLLTYQTATSHQKFASGVHDNLRKQGEK